MFDYHEIDSKELEYITIASVEELTKGDRILVEIDGLAIAVFHIGDEYFAISDVCSHDDGPVAEGNLDGKKIICPRHGAAFDLATGKALTLPAVVDIPAYPVRVAEDKIQVGLPIND
jgi:3-phenylpropionate/trans-cinnamate dioxygenase ferredoxin subunit